MNQCVFQKWLDHQLMYPVMSQTLLHVNRADKRIIKPLLLQIHISFQILQFILYLYDLIAFVNTVPQNCRKTREHLTDRIFFIVQRYPVDGIQRIIQKVWVDLCFQRFDFRILDAHQRFFFLFIGLVDFPII